MLRDVFIDINTRMSEGISSDLVRKNCDFPPNKIEDGIQKFLHVSVNVQIDWSELNLIPYIHNIMDLGQATTNHRGRPQNLTEFREVGVSFALQFRLTSCVSLGLCLYICILPTYSVGQVVGIAFNAGFPPSSITLLISSSSSRSSYGT